MYANARHTQTAFTTLTTHTNADVSCLAAADQCRYLLVRLGGEELDVVAAAAPGLVYAQRLGLVVAGVGHHCGPSASS